MVFKEIFDAGRVTDECARLYAEAERLAIIAADVIEKAADSEAVRMARDVLIKVGVEYLEKEARDRLGLPPSPPAPPDGD